jgi:hypothetical protein
MGSETSATGFAGYDGVGDRHPYPVISTRGWRCVEHCLHTKSPRGAVVRDFSGHRICWACAQPDPVDLGNRRDGVVERRLVRDRGAGRRRRGGSR